jgi:hypothetical protein
MPEYRPLTIPKAQFFASSFSAAVDILPANIGITTIQADLGAAILRFQFKLSASAVVNVIHKDRTGSVYGTCAINSGVQLAAGNAYGFVYLINRQSLYNFQLSAAANIIGQIDEIQGVFI